MKLHSRVVLWQNSNFLEFFSEQGVASVVSRDELHLSSSPFTVSVPAMWPTEALAGCGARSKKELPLLLPGSDYPALQAFLSSSCIFCTCDSYSNGSEHKTGDCLIYVSAIEGCNIAMV